MSTFKKNIWSCIENMKSIKSEKRPLSESCVLEFSTAFQGLINSNTRVMDHQNWAGPLGKEQILVSTSKNKI